MPFATSPWASTPIAGNGDAATTNPTIVAAATLPGLVVNGRAYPVTHVSVTAKLPNLLAAANVVGVLRGTVICQLPPLRVKSFVGAFGGFQIPKLVATTQTAVGSIADATVTLAKPTFCLHTGVVAKAKLPKLSVVAGTTSTTVIAGKLRIHRPVANCVVLVDVLPTPERLTGALYLPRPKATTRLGVKATNKIPKLIASASLTAGSVINAKVWLPNLVGVSTCVANNVIVGLLKLPQLRVLPRIRVSAKISTPLITASCMGSDGVVETWVVNLKHDPKSPPTGEADVDEVTTYTNYDFEQIVRHGSHYYGVGKRGIFKLGEVVGDDSGVPQTTTTTTTPGTPGTTVVRKTGLIIPWYIYPDNAASGGDVVLNAFLAERVLHPDVDVQVIVNPDNGAGWVTDPNYQAFIDTLGANNCTTLAYIPTTYSNRPIRSVKDEVIRWGDLYQGLDGIFYDEAASTDTSGTIAYYQEIVAYAHAMGYSPVCINAGMAVPDSFYTAAGMFDTVVVFENNRYQQAGDFPAQPSSSRDKKCVMVYNNQFDAANVGYLVDQARWVYVSDCGAGYDSLPTYLHTLFVACNPVTTVVGGTPPTTTTVVTGGSVPVEFYFKTGLHDFRSQTLKTLASAYIAGRVDGGVIIELFPGENAVQPQRFTTPRGKVAQTYRQRFPLGNKQRYYAIGVGGNTPFVLDALGIELANMTRRI